MHSEYIREFHIMEQSEEQKNEELLRTIRYVKDNLKSMYSNLQFAENDLIDYFTYQIKAEEAKYDYLIKEAKKKKLNII